MGIAGMTLAEQAVRRLDLARHMGCEPQRWVATPAAEAQLIGEADEGAWSEDRTLFLGLPIERAPVRSEWGLDLISAPSGVQ